MAFTQGSLIFHLEHAQGLKDSDWFGKQDPYAVVRVAGVGYRSRTHVNGGRNPVWNQTFTFNIHNEDAVKITLYDQDTATQDDLLGTATISLDKVRQQGSDRVEAQVIRKSGKKGGTVTVTLSFSPATVYAQHAPFHKQPAPRPNQPSSTPPPYSSNQATRLPVPAPASSQVQGPGSGLPSLHAQKPAANASPPRRSSHSNPDLKLLDQGAAGGLVDRSHHSASAAGYPVANVTPLPLPAHVPLAHLPPPPPGYPVFNAAA